MADRLSVRIDLNSQVAQNRMEKFIRALNHADTALKKAGASVRGFGNETATGTVGVERLASKLDDANKKIQKGTSYTKSFGREMVSTFHGAGNMAMRLARNLSLLGGILGGFSVARIGSEFIEFSKQMGVMNATIMGSGETIRKIQNQTIVNAAKAGVSPTELAKAQTRMFSSEVYSPFTKGAEGSPEFTQATELVSEISGQLATLGFATGTDTTILAEAFTKYGEIFNKDIKTKEDITATIDKFQALLTISQGELGQLIPEFGKFGKSMMDAGLKEDEALAVFATLTNAYGTEEAGTRALRFSTFFKDSVGAIDRINTARAKIQDPSQKALFDVEDIFFSTDDQGLQTQRGFQEVLDGLSNKMKQFKDDRHRLEFTKALFPEVREESAIRQIMESMDSMNNSLVALGDAAGLSGKAFASAMEVPGMKLAYFSQNANGAFMQVSEALAQTVLNFGDLEKMDLSSVSASISEIATNLDEKLGSGAGNLIRPLASFVEFLDSDAGAEWVRRIATAFENLGRIVSTVFNAFVSFMNNPAVTGFIDWVSSNPALNIPLTVAGYSLVKSGLENAIMGGFTNAAAGIASRGGLAGLLSTAGGALTLAALTSGFIEVAKMSISTIEAQNNEWMDRSGRTLGLMGQQSNAVKNAESKLQSFKGTPLEAKYQLEYDEAVARRNLVEAQGQMEKDMANPLNRLMTTISPSGLNYLQSGHKVEMAMKEMEKIEERKNKQRSYGWGWKLDEESGTAKNMDISSGEIRTIDALANWRMGRGTITGSNLEVLNKTGITDKMVGSYNLEGMFGIPTQIPDTISAKLLSTLANEKGSSKFDESGFAEAINAEIAKLSQSGQEISQAQINAINAKKAADVAAASMWASTATEVAGIVRNSSVSSSPAMGALGGLLNGLRGNSASKTNPVNG